MSLAHLAIFSVSLAGGEFLGIAGWAWLLIFLGVCLVVALLLISNASFSARSPYLEGLAHGVAHEEPSVQVEIPAGFEEASPVLTPSPDLTPAPDLAAAPPAAAAAPENLEIIEGIGPKINQILQDAGITSFAQLAGTSVDRLNEVLHAAGLRVNDPTTWPDQARLASEGKWSELEELQNQLRGGRRS